ncbi:MAG: ATP-dependent protease ATPase subunit HslU [Thermoguttaceae bacterium]|nr:ATP-dependent protease ATPase subunit HslU [Thermoguttaceae bacterium]
MSEIIPSPSSPRLPSEQEFAELTPRKVVAELDRFIIGQQKAKRSVAIALRNRWRRQQVDPEMRKEIGPKNIMMIGPTGVGKTEIVRRLAAMTRAPFIKVEATKYTEIGYFGRDVESMVRELVENAIGIVREDFRKRYETEAKAAAEERLVDLIASQIPEWEKQADRAADSLAGDRTPADSGPAVGRTPMDTMIESLRATFPNLDESVGMITPEMAQQIQSNPNFPLPGFADMVKKLQEGARGDSSPSSSSSAAAEPAGKKRTVDKDEVRRRLAAGEYEDAVVPIVTEKKPQNVLMAGIGMDTMENDLQNMFENILPHKSARRELPVRDARKVIYENELERLINHEKVNEQAIAMAENFGIIFIDEIDKIVASGSPHNADVSRQGVQRDLLPIVEGTTVKTKYGYVSTEHVLFIAAGAFHRCRPSDLMPELQGRFPIRVELSALTEEDFCKILTEPHGSLTEQYTAMMKTEGVDLVFEEDAIAALAHYAHELNQTSQNIGARRLYTIMERLLEELSFEAPDMKMGRVVINAAYVAERLDKVAGDEDLSKFIL